MWTETFYPFTGYKNIQIEEKKEKVAHIKYCTMCKQPVEPSRPIILGKLKNIYIDCEKSLVS